MADSSGSELGDPVDPLNMEGLEEGEVPPSPAQKDERMEISAEDGKTLKEMRIVSRNRKAGNRNPAWTRKATTLLSPGWVGVRMKT